MMMMWCSMSHKQNCKNNCHWLPPKKMLRITQWNARNTFLPGVFFFFLRYIWCRKKRIIFQAHVIFVLFSWVFPPSLPILSAILHRLHTWREREKKQSGAFQAQNYLVFPTKHWRPQRQYFEVMLVSTMSDPYPNALPHHGGHGGRTDTWMSPRRYLADVGRVLGLMGGGGEARWEGGEESTKDISWFPVFLGI